MDFNAFIGKVQSEILTPIITVVALGAFILFVFGVVEFIRGADKPDARKKGQDHILWGLVGLAILFGANVIVTILKNIASGI